MLLIIIYKNTIFLHNYGEVSEIKIFIIFFFYEYFVLIKRLIFDYVFLKC